MEEEKRRFTLWQEIFMYVATLCAFQLYNYVGFEPRFVHALLYLFILCTLFFCAKTCLGTNAPQLFNLMRWIWIVTFFSIFMSWMFCRQGLVLGAKATAQYLVFIFFFYLCQVRPPIEKMERYIWFFGFLFVLLWIYAASQFPLNVFGYSEDEEITDVSRGIERIRGFIGRLSLIFAFFLAINKFYDTKKKIYILFAVLFFFVLVMQLGRMLIFSTGIVTIFYVWIRSRGILITIACILVAAVLSGLSFMEIDDNSVVGSLINTSEEQYERQKGGREDIRITEYRYMFTEHNRNLATNLLGSGYPNANSPYGKYVKRLNSMRMIYFTDVGYGDMYATTGLIGVLLHFLLYFKCLKVPLPQHLHYVKLFVLFLIVSNLTSDFYARVDGQIAMSVCVYIMIAYRAKGEDVRLLNMFKDCQ